MRRCSASRSTPTFKRCGYAMQINNETYLRPHEATALVKQLRGCSTGWAAELVERAINSGKVRTHMGGVQNLRRRPGDPPARPITLSNLEDLIYWLDRDAPAPGPLSAAATAQFQPG